MQAFASQNNGYRYILTIIDVFSKRAFVFPIKKKSGGELASAFRQLFTTFIPANFQTDKGTEFKNKQVEEVMKQHNVNFYFSQNSDIKCGVVERFNRTFKGRMFKYFSSRGTRKYIDVLPLLVSAYNNSYHRTIKMAPNSVNDSNVETVFHNMYGYEEERNVLFKSRSENRVKFKVGDCVRLKYELKPMDKSYYPNWSDPIYTITVVIKGLKRVMYRLKNEAGEEVPKRFYQEELQIVDKDTGFRINVLRRDKKKKRVLVQWLNHPGTKPSWIPEKDLL